MVGSGDYLGLGLGHDQFLLENPSGAVDIGQVGSNKIATLTPFATLGTWTVVGSGDFLGEGHDQFLIENASGQVYIGQEYGGAGRLPQLRQPRHDLEDHRRSATTSAMGTTSS